jgi:hypothetical protein
VGAGIRSGRRSGQYREKRLASIGSNNRELFYQLVNIIAAKTIAVLNRLPMSAWAMMRRAPGAPSLATNGQLSGSQGGSRILWRFDRRFAASLRTSAQIDGVQRSAEVAAGPRWQPFPSIRVALTAERRQSFGPDKGLGAFALFAEGGVFDRPIVAGFNLDAYLQAGVVGVRHHAGFVDGSATLSRPMWGQLSAGFGMWRGTQPGLSRLEVGPRLSWCLGRRMRVHADSGLPSRIFCMGGQWGGAGRHRLWNKLRG